MKNAALDFLSMMQPPLIHFSFGGERIILQIPVRDTDGRWNEQVVGMDANVAHRLIGELREAIDAYHADRVYHLNARIRQLEYALKQKDGK